MGEYGSWDLDRISRRVGDSSCIYIPWGSGSPCIFDYSGTMRLAYKPDLCLLSVHKAEEESRCGMQEKRCTESGISNFLFG